MSISTASLFPVSRENKVTASQSEACYRTSRDLVATIVETQTLTTCATYFSGYLTYCAMIGSMAAAQIGYPSAVG